MFLVCSYIVFSKCTLAAIAVSTLGSSLTAHAACYALPTSGSLCGVPVTLLLDRLPPLARPNGEGVGHAATYGLILLDIEVILGQ